MQTLEKIDEGAFLRIAGNVTITGNIGDGAILYVEGYRVLINGHVGKNVKILIVVNQQPLICGVNDKAICFKGVHTPSDLSLDSLAALDFALEHSPSLTTTQTIMPHSSSATAGLFIKGNIGDFSRIQSDVNVTVDGHVGSHCRIRTEYGHIKAKDIGANSKCRTSLGDISVDVVSSGVFLYTTIGDISAKQRLKGSSVTSNSGNITIEQSSDADAPLSYVGQVTINGQVQPRATRVLQFHLLQFLRAKRLKGGRSGIRLLSSLTNGCRSLLGINQFGPGVYTLPTKHAHYFKLAHSLFNAKRNKLHNFQALKHFILQLLGAAHLNDKDYIDWFINSLATRYQYLVRLNPQNANTYTPALKSAQELILANNCFVQTRQSSTLNDNQVSLTT